MIRQFDEKKPQVDESALVATSACVLGDVIVGPGSSIWFNAVVRADVGSIVIGKRSNIQDSCVLHLPWGGRISIGDDVTVGHRAVVHGCKLGDRILVGMGAIIMDGAEVGDDCIIGAGAVVTEGTEIPPRSLVLGTPARVKRELSEDEVRMLAEHAAKYAQLATRYKKYGL